MTVTAAMPRISNHRQRLDVLHEKTDKLHLFEFWGDDSADQHQGTKLLCAGKLDAVPYHWHYRDIEPCLLEAAKLVPSSMSERRSLIIFSMVDQTESTERSSYASRRPAYHSHPICP